MPPVDVNYLAVVVAAIAYMALGFFWYSPAGFGKPWMKLVGMTEEHMKNAGKGMQKTYAISFVAALLMAYVLGVFVDLAEASTVAAGVQVGFWAWVGFVATTGANEFLFAVKPKPWKLYWINQGYLLVSLLVAGAILAVWA